MRNAVILPVNAEFADASPQLEFQDSEDSNVIAALNYTYSGQPVGSTSLYLADSGIQEFNFQRSVEEGETLPDEPPKAAEPEVNLVKINLRAVGIAVCSLLLFLTVLLLIRKVASDFDVELNPIRRWQNWRDRKNAFGSPGRRRYRSRRRNRRGRRF